MAGAKKYHKAPFMIADEVAEKLQSSKVVKDVASVKPGFLNFNLDNEYLASYVNQMKTSNKHGIELSAPVTKMRITNNFISCTREDCN